MGGPAPRRQPNGRDGLNGRAGRLSSGGPNRRYSPFHERTTRFLVAALLLLSSPSGWRREGQDYRRIRRGADRRGVCRRLHHEQRSRNAGPAGDHGVADHEREASTASPRRPHGGRRRRRATATSACAKWAAKSRRAFEGDHHRRSGAPPREQREALVAARPRALGRVDHPGRPGRRRPDPLRDDADTSRCSVPDKRARSRSTKR